MPFRTWRTRTGGTTLAFAGRRAEDPAASPELAGRLLAKKQRRAADEAAKPLAAYRAEELARMQRNFYAEGEPYHQLRRNFVHKVCPTATPAHLLG